MKRVFLLFAALLLVLSGYSQTSGGPDAYGYTWKNSNHTTNPPIYQWFDITQIGSEVSGLGDDNYVGPYTASNGFQYYWYPVNQFWIGSNGYISFNGNNIASPFPSSIPLSSGANNWIAPMLSDLNFAGANNPADVYLFYNNDTVCISYLNVPFWESSPTGYTGSCTFQIILNKTDKSITFNYQSMNLGNVTSLDNAVGIENNTGNLGLGCMFDALPGNNFTIKFTYPSTVTYAVYDAGIDWNMNEKSAATFVKKGYPVTLQANVRNFGNQNLTGIDVKDTVRWVNSAVISTGLVNNIALTAGSDTTIVLPNIFTPLMSGTYTFSAITTGVSTDMVAANNRNLQEMIAIDTNSSTIFLDYSDGTVDGTGLGWVGGGGGIAIYVEPPFYPCEVLSSRFIITANAASPVGFYSKIYDNTGLNGTPGNLLDSVFVSPSSIVLNNYTNVTAQNYIKIDSGGIYLLWVMGGADINLGRDLTPPYSHRTYEVLGNVWAEYRDKFTEDFQIGLRIRYAAPSADFSFDNVADPSISFTDLSLSNPQQWSWDFDDGGGSSAQNPTHVYSTNGSFNVCLIATNGAGSDTICKTVSISGVNSPPVAGFTYIDTAMPVISFIDQSAGSPTSWAWDFDDGNNSTQQNPSHTFTTNGTFNVCLTATNSYGSSSPYCQNVVVIGIGIDEANAGPEVTLSPNPFTESCIIEIEGSYSDLTLRCFSLAGKLIELDYSITGNRITLNKGSLKSGTYIIEIISNEIIISTNKIVVW